MKTLLLIIPILLLAACGFHPVYGVNKHTAPGQNVEAQLPEIIISNIPNREGQYLRNALIDRFYRDGRPNDARYFLNVGRVGESKRNLDITIDSDTTRAQLKLSTSITLMDRKNNEPLLKKGVSSTASYNVLGSEFANRVSEQSTRENLLDDLARQIETQIALYFKQ